MPDKKRILSHTFLNTGPFFIMAAGVAWALDGLIRTGLTTVLSPVAIVWFEHAIGTVILLPLMYTYRRTVLLLTRADWGLLFTLTLVSSILGTVLFTTALSKSFTTGDFVTPLLLQKLQPVIVILLAAAFLRERLTKRFMTLLPFALTGSYLISFGTNLPQLAWAGKELVVMLALGAALSWGGGTILSKSLLNKYHPAAVTGLRFIAATILTLPVALLIGQVIPFSAVMDPAVFFRFLLIAFTTGAGALLVYYLGLSKTTASVATVSELTFPLASVLIAVTALNPYGSPQTLSAANILGIIILTGSVLGISLEYAGRSYKLSGIVVKGAGDGKKIGFPTANIEPDHTPGIRFGVYAARLTVGGKQYRGVMHYGPRMVFGETRPQWEVYILDFDRDIYGKRVSARILKFLRPTKPLPSMSALKKQIREDVSNAQTYFTDIS